MRRPAMLATLATLAVVLGGCDARSSTETALVFVLLFGTLARIFVDSDTR